MTTSESFHTTKIFNHFFYWGMLTVSGDCRRVHPESIGEEDDKREEEEMKKKKKKKPTLAHSILRDLNEAAAGSGPSLGTQEGEEGQGEEEEEEEDDEMALLLKEMEWLRLEGNRKAADLVEKKINQIRLEKLKKIRAQSVCPLPTVVLLLLNIPCPPCPHYPVLPSIESIKPQIWQVKDSPKLLSINRRENLRIKMLIQM
jgi:hypothetical protein